jgi:hypothetical protein
MVKAVVSTNPIKATVTPVVSGRPQQVSVTLPSGSNLQNTALKLRLLGDVNATTLNDGALIQYDANTEKFTTRNELETTTGTLKFNGGNF